MSPMEIFTHMWGLLCLILYGQFFPVCGLVWNPNEKPSIQVLDIDNTLGNESFTEHLSLHLSSAPILRYRRINFKQQLMQAFRVLDHTPLSLMGSHIKIHEKRFQKLTHLHTNDNFMTRKDLNHEFLIKHHLQFHTCQSFCINNKATMLNTKSALQDIRKFTPRYSGISWIKTSQSVKIDGYQATYDIQFQNISLPENYSSLGFNGIEIFHINDNQSLEQIDFDEIGVTTNYWSSIKDGRYYEKIPLQLLSSYKQKENVIRILVPVATHALVHQDYYGRCVCQRSLFNNDANLEKARNILKTSLSFRFNTPQNIELLRLKDHSPASASTIFSLMQQNQTAPNSKIIHNSDLHPLLLGFSSEPCTGQNCQFDEPKSKETQDLLHYLFDNRSKIGLTHNSHTKRAVLASLGTSIFVKALAMSSPYLLQATSQPFKKLLSEFHHSQQLYADPSIQFSNTTELNQHLNVQFQNTPLKLIYAQNKFDISIRHQFPALERYTTENVAFAEEIRRASEILGFYGKMMDQEIPKIILNSIIANSKYPISANPILFDIFHSASFAVFRAYYEIIRLDQQFETTELLALPHKVMENDLFYFSTSNHSLDSSQLSSSTSVAESKCFNSMISTTPTPLHHCKEIKKVSSIFSKILTLKHAFVFQIKGPSTIKISCLGQLSDTIKLPYDVNLLLISQSCDLAINHKSLTKFVDRQSQQLSSFKFKILLQYQLVRFNSFKQNILFILHIIAIILSIIIVFILSFLAIAVYIKHRYKPKFYDDNLTIEHDQHQSLPVSHNSLHNISTLEELQTSTEKDRQSKIPLRLKFSPPGDKN